MIAEPVYSVHDLLRQLALTDLVVATRFHNVLLALLLEKPVISISYNQKNDDLMGEMGLGAFCQPIDELNVERLHDQFLRLQATAGTLRPQVTAQTVRHRQLLDEQYERVVEYARAAGKPIRH